MRRYTRELEAKVEQLIPKDIHIALANKGWNVFGVFEQVESAIKTIRREGHKPFKGSKSREPKG